MNKKFFHELMTSPTIKLIITILAFTISSYATYSVFAVGKEGAEFTIGIIKTIVCEACKILFYVEVKKNKNKNNLFFWLWIFFLGMSLLHSMNYEISMINKYENQKVQKASSYTENTDVLKSLQTDKINKQKEIDLYVKSIKESAANLKTEKESVSSTYDSSIKDISKQLDGAISKYGPSRTTKKTEKIAEKARIIEKTLAEESNKIGKLESAAAAKIKSDKESLEFANGEMKDIKEDIQKYSTKTIKSKKELEGERNEEGLSVIISTFLSLSVKTTEIILTLIIALFVAISFDLAGCKMWQSYLDDLKKLDNFAPVGNMSFTLSSEKAEKKAEKVSFKKVSTKPDIMHDVQEKKTEKKTEEKVNLKDGIKNTEITKYVDYMFDNLKNGFLPGAKNISDGTGINKNRCGKIRHWLDTENFITTKKCGNINRSVAIVKKDVIMRKIKEVY